jgi:hypothetical protein
MDDGSAYGDRGNGYWYGWSADNRPSARDRDASGSPSQLYDTLLHMQSQGTFKWEIALPNGRYQVRLVSGDPNYYNSIFRIKAEGALALDGKPTSDQRWVEATVVVDVADGKLTLSNGADSVNNKINFIEIVSQ